MTLLINLVNTILLVFIVLYCLKKKIDSSFFWVAITSLYFINIPLLYDSFNIFLIGEENWERVVEDTNLNWTKGTLKLLNNISFDSLLFNIAFIFSYFLVKGKFNYLLPKEQANSLLSNIPWLLCIVICFLTLVLFIYFNQITDFSTLQTGMWYKNRLNNPILGLIINILVPLNSLVVFKMLAEKKIIFGIISLIPLIIIAAISGSRANIISAFFIGFYYLIIVVKKWNVRKILSYFLIGFFAVLFLNYFRGHLGLYPETKDSSYSDLFYSYSCVDNITTNGEGTLRLLQTGFIHNSDKNYRDVTTELGNYKYFDGWGSIHPTLLGWAYIDLKENYFILAIFIGILLGLIDRFRYLCTDELNVFFLPYLFTFISVGMRGSLQYAYSILIYPLFILIAIYLYLRFLNRRIRGNKYEQ